MRYAIIEVDDNYGFGAIPDMPKELILCRDCEYWAEDDFPFPEACKRYDCHMTAQDYCSRAEQKWNRRNDNG